MRRPSSVSRLPQIRPIVNAPIDPPEWFTENFLVDDDGSICLVDVPEGLPLGTQAIAWPIGKHEVPITRRRTIDFLIVEVYRPQCGTRTIHYLAGETHRYSALTGNAKANPPAAEQDPAEFLGLMQEFGVILDIDAASQDVYREEFYRVAEAITPDDDGHPTEIIATRLLDVILGDRGKLASLAA